MFVPFEGTKVNICCVAAGSAGTRRLARERALVGPAVYTSSPSRAGAGCRVGSGALGGSGDRVGSANRGGQGSRNNLSSRAQ